jgi:F-type H+-transporting ATPase subunit a
MERDLYRSLLAGLILFLFTFSSFAASEPHNNKAAEEPINPKEFIFHHIQDAHDWHITKLWNGKDITIPLPVILYSKHSGFHVFSSKKLSHGHTYRNFELPHHGEHAGKIIEHIKGEENVYLPLDVSITKNVVAALFSIILMLWLFISIARRYKKNPLRAPKGMQSLFEPIIIFIRDEIAKPSIGEHKYERFMPYLLTIFFFIWFNNMLGLIPIFPGGANLTGNITVTLTLAFFTYIITSLNGNKNYWKHIFNTPGVPWWLKAPVPLMPVIEFLGTIIKPITLMIRLFANITAGHIIVLSFFAMIFIFGEMEPVAGYSSPVLIIPFTIFMTFLELLVALIQAAVFTLLSSLYFGLATEEAHH